MSGMLSAMTPDCEHLGAQQYQTRPATLETGLQFHVAESVDEVLEAWRLVYHAYRQVNLIDPNHLALHTFEQAISPSTAVIVGRIGSMTASTLSAYLDSERGLPLDSVYARELGDLRRQGRMLMELGLFADRRQHRDRHIGALLELMRHACYFGVHQGVTDAVVGVHPHHVKFYTRMLGFEAIGKERSYAAVNDNPVVLLRLDWPRAASLPRLNRGIEHILRAPLSPDAFKSRFDFAPDVVMNSDLAHFVTPPQPRVT